MLEAAVWEEVKCLLKDPRRILEEYQRRILELNSSPLDQLSDSLTKQENKLKRGISSLIDSYTQEHIDKKEFEPRIKMMKQHLKMIEEQKQKINDQKHLKKGLTRVVIHLENFASSVKLNLEKVDWHTQRDIIRMLVKRIEINREDVNVVFRVKELPDYNEPQIGEEVKYLQHCGGSTKPFTR